MSFVIQLLYMLLELLLHFFMGCLSVIPLAIFFELNFAFYFALIFAGPIVDPFTFRALKFYEKIL